MSELLERIRSGGHWRVLIRPASFGKKRIPNVDELFHLLDNTSVRLRGRAFPVVRSDRSLVFEDHIEYEEEDDKFAESGVSTRAANLFIILPSLKTDSILQE